MLNKNNELSGAAFVGALLYSVGVFTLIITIGYGWVLNIMTLLGSADVLSLGQLVVRVAGIFLVPLGGVMGYIGV